MCSGSLCCICGLISLTSCLFFYGFNLWSVPGFILLSLVVVFNISIALVLLLHVDLICSQAHILTSECFCGTH